MVSWDMSPNGNPGLSPKLVAVTEGPVDLTAAGAETWLRVDPEASQALAAALADTGRSHRGEVSLSLEGITGQRPANLAVYLGSAEGAGAAANPEQRAGVLGLYGIGQASKVDKAGEGGGGMTFALDVSDLVARLRLAGPPVPATIRVRIVPSRPLLDGAQIRVGAIRLIHFPAA